MFNEALAAHQEGRWNDAIDGFERYLLAVPNHVPALTNRANLLFWTGRFAEAADAYRQLGALTEPSSQLLRRLGMSLLALGDPAGWPLFNLKPRPAAVNRFSFPQWRGEPLAGKSLIVWQDQGFGDQIQMVRYVAPLLEVGARVTWAPPRTLAGLFNSIPGLEVIPCDPGEPVAIPHHDFWALPFDLPQWVGDIPAAPYIPCPSRPVSQRVGFVWHGNPHQPVERHRGLPTASVLDPLREVAELIDLQEPAGDFAHTAEVIAGLSLIITTDTAMAHLAGALGRPCWVLLPALHADWRWGSGERTIWYPSSRLFRQVTPGDWVSVVERMRLELSASRAGR